jgi:hypothetical protein
MQGVPPGGDDGKAILPDATGICNYLSHPSEEFAELDGHAHLLISRMQASLYEMSMSTASLAGYLRNSIQRLRKQFPRYHPIRIASAWHFSWAYTSNVQKGELARIPRHAELHKYVRDGVR